MPHSSATIMILLVQCMVSCTGLADASISNSTVPVSGSPTNVTVPANAYPIGTNSTGIENGSTSKNATLSDQQLNAYWPGPDEYPLWNQSTSAHYHSNYTVLYDRTGSNTTTSKLKRRDNVLLRISMSFCTPRDATQVLILCASASRSIYHPRI